MLLHGINIFKLSSVVFANIRVKVRDTFFLLSLYNGTSQ
jgi:hypothetical protein